MTTAECDIWFYATALIHMHTKDTLQYCHFSAACILDTTQHQPTNLLTLLVQNRRREVERHSRQAIELVAHRAKQIGRRCLSESTASATGFTLGVFFFFVCVCCSEGEDEDVNTFSKQQRLKLY
jgi:hypothetical protein